MWQLRSKQTLDHNDHGWLKARHHSVVTAEGNRANGALGALVVWNDDEIAPGTGFGRHSHADIEIVTYVRHGAVTHEDSTGNAARIVAGDVQVMSAGTGISHSEHNRDTLLIRADARVLGATLFAGTTLTHAPDRFRHTYLAPARGAIRVNGQRVELGDGIASIDEPELTIMAEGNAEFILVDAA
jgi:redox-sensitive bicupin YhaK (pirin superfamily)